MRWSLTQYRLFFLIILVIALASETYATKDTATKKDYGTKIEEESIVMSNEQTSFPELVGIDGEVAKARLQKKFPDFTIKTVPDGSMVTMDYRLDRIRIFVDKDRKVSQAPSIG